MFELSFAKIFVVAVVALIVLGPERLPTVARTLGTIIGRAQRFVASVKAEVNAQTQNSGLDSFHEDVIESVNTVKSSVESMVSEVKQSVNELQTQIVNEANHQSADSQFTEGEPEGSQKLNREKNISEAPSEDVKHLPQGDFDSSDKPTKYER